MKKNLLITGRPGVGKTTLVMKAIEASGLDATGFYTEEIRIGGERKGFKVKTFSGKEGILPCGGGPQEHQSSIQDVP